MKGDKVHTSLKDLCYEDKVYVAKKLHRTIEHILSLAAISESDKEGEKGDEERKAERRKLEWLGGVIFLAENLNSKTCNQI